MQNPEMDTNVLEQIRQTEKRVDDAVRKTRSEAEDKLQLRKAENELRVQETQKRLDESRREKAAQVENQWAEQTRALLAQAKEEAGTLRQNAMTHMNDAVAQVVQAVLGQM